MRTPRVGLAVALVCLTPWLVGGSRAADQPEPPRTVSVAVTVHSADGSPIANVPLEGSSHAGEGFGRTDASGLATISLPVGTTEARVCVRLSLGMKFHFAPSVVKSTSARFWELNRLYHFKDGYVVPIQEGQSAYTTVITASSAVVVSGRLVDTQATPLKGGAHVRDGGSVQMIMTGGSFAIGGVRQGTAGEIFFSSGTPTIVSVRLLPEHTQADHSIGDVVIPTMAQESTVRLHITNREGLDTLVESKRGGISLISSDGARILSFHIDADGHAILSPDSGTAIMIPAGTYYAAPGTFLGTQEQLLLLDALRRGVDAGASAVPKIIAVAGQEASLTFDAVQCETAIRSLPPP